MATLVDTEEGLKRAAARERRGLFLIAVPSLAFMVLLLILPLCFLVGLSFVRDGGFSLANYARIFSDTFYAQSFWLTVQVAAVVTLATGVMGYLVAYALTLMPRWLATICLAMVALPFWTSALVRTYAWLVLLQNRGIVNNMLTGLGIIDAPLRLMHNLTGTLIGMIHIMLPFMVFPVYAGLQRIDPDYMRAAFGLGSSPSYAFWRVYFPLSLPGLTAGVIMVFVVSLGFFVTPVLLGGGRTMMMSIVIYRDVSLTLDWGPAAAIATLFVIAVLAIFGLAARAVSLERIFQR